MPQKQRCNFDAFLCYRRSDGGRAARWLRTRLQGYRIPKPVVHQLDRTERELRTKPLRIYLDTAYERGDSDYWEKGIRPSLEQSRYLIVLWTPDASRKKEGWDPVWKEIDFFCRQHGGDRIVLVLAKGTDSQPLPGRMDELSPRVEIRRITHRTPLRFLWFPAMFALSEEVTKIAATLYEFPRELMPQLHQEAHKRRIRRLSLALGIGAALLVVMLLLLFTTLHSLSERNTALGEANRNLSTALLTRAISAGRQHQHHKALVYLAEAKRLSPSPRWPALSMLAGTPVATRAGRISMGSKVIDLDFHPSRDGLIVSTDDGIHLIDVLTKRSVGTLDQSEGFRSVRISPSGNYLASRRSNTIQIWEFGDRRLPLLKGGPENAPATHSAFGLAFRPGSEELAYGWPDGSVRTWSADRHTAAGPFPSQKDAWIGSLCYSPDGGQLAAVRGHVPIAIQLWSVADRKPISSVDLRGTGVALSEFAFSPAGSHIAVAGNDGMILILDVPSMKVVHRISLHVDYITCLAFHPSGEILASGGADRTVHLVDVAGGRELALLESHQGPLTSLDFRPDGKILASASSDGSITLWDLDLRAVRRRDHKHEGFAHSVAVDSKGRRIALSASVGEVTFHLTEAISREQLNWMDAHGLLGVPLPSMRGYGGTSARLIDLETETVSHTLSGSADSVNAVAFNGDASLVAGVGGSGGLRLWDPETGNLESSDSHVDVNASSVAFSHRGNLLAVGNSDQTTQFWRLDPTTRALTRAFVLGSPERGNHNWSRMRFSLDDRLLAFESRWGQASIWDLQERKKLHPPAQAIDEAIPRVVTPDLSLVVYRTSAGNLQLRSALSGRTVGEVFAAEVKRNARLVPSENSRLLAVQTEDGSVEVWDLRSQRLRATLAPMRGTVDPLTFDPSSTLLITTIRELDSLAMWDAMTGENLGEMRYELYPTDARFASDGSTLILWGDRKLWFIHEVPQSSLERAEQLSGFRLNGLGLEQISPRRRASLDVGYPVKPNDESLVVFWRSLWEVKFNLERLTFRERQQEKERCAQPLRDWCDKYPRHPMIDEALWRLAQIL